MNVAPLIMRRRRKNERNGCNMSEEGELSRDSTAGKESKERERYERNEPTKTYLSFVCNIDVPILKSAYDMELNRNSWLNVTY